MTLTERMERQNPEQLPTVMLYADLLSEAQRKFRITREQARERYGMYTNQQWLELLNL